MAKPTNITKEFIEKAIKQIDEKGIEKGHEILGYSLNVAGKEYPPKYVVALARALQFGGDVDTKDFNSDDANDILKKNQFYPKRVSNEIKFWKISHGKDNVKPESLRQALRERHVIVMASDTGKKQGDRFVYEVKKGDIFYLCYTNSIQLIGQITSESASLNPEMGGTWVEHSYNTLYESKNKETYPGQGFRRGWTPNYTSTLFEIKKTDFPDFEKHILRPYFEIGIKDLLDQVGLDTHGEGKSECGSEIAKNTILYGPPGTGKTYHTAIYAVAICNSDRSLKELKEEAKTKEGYERIYSEYQKLIDEGRVKFTTFHQSYGYEDFIEGIKPNIVKGNIEYRVEDGVFKKFCGLSLDAAWDCLIKEAQNNKNIINVKWIVDNTDRSLECKKKQKDDDYAFYDSFNEDGNSQYHNATKEGIAQWLDNIDKGLDENSNFPSNRRHLNLCKSVYQKLRKDFNLNNPNLNKVFIIDEINRGNISKIFGELITLIEDDKRDVTHVTLPLSPTERFTVPKNVYILGTMNTADRSIALMDTALRRRFTFVEMMPEPEVFVIKGADGNDKDVTIEGVNIKSLLRSINERIEYLYDREHTIGHAYFKEFIGGKGDIGGLRATFKNKIIPLLQEYFYDDYEKIALVLADENAKTKFIKVKNAPAEWLGKQYDEGEKYDIDPMIWGIKDEDFAARLVEIYEKNNNKQTEEESE